MCFKLIHNIMTLSEVIQSINLLVKQYFAGTHCALRQPTEGWPG